jgi:hypothetical protein
MTYSVTATKCTVDFALQNDLNPLSFSSKKNQKEKTELAVRKPAFFTTS